MAHALAKRKRAPEGGGRGEFMGTSNWKLTELRALPPTSRALAFLTGGEQFAKIEVMAAHLEMGRGMASIGIPRAGDPTA
jgi:hypothetical protein